MVVVLMGSGAILITFSRSRQQPVTSLLPQLTRKSSNASDNIFSRQYSRGKCQGSGTTAFAYPQMRIEDIGSILPYGLMVDAHVIPTSHGYVSPKIFNSPPDAYPVYAIADGTIVFVAHRGEFVGDKKTNQVVNDYQLYVEYSCTFYSYYDLLTSLSPEIEKHVGKLKGFERKYVRIPVKAGQLIGRVGGKTVDFAVWNFEKEPAFFVNPKNYEDDEDRFYLEDMFVYFVEPIKSQLLAKNVRIAEPESGEVAYDIDGKLVGNWFEPGSGGFRGPRTRQVQGSPGRYWDGHLAIVYDYIDPTQIRFSIGNFNGKAAQFGVSGNAPDPANVGVESGLVKYELQHYDYYNKDTGRPWSTSDGPVANPGSRNFGPVRATVLLQLIEPRKLKVELFSNLIGEQAKDFTAAASIYER